MNLVIQTRRRNIDASYVNDCLKAYEGTEAAKRINLVQFAKTEFSRTFIVEDGVEIETIVMVEK